MLIYFIKDSTFVELEFKRSPIAEGEGNVTLNLDLLEGEGEVEMRGLLHVVRK